MVHGKLNGMMLDHSYLICVCSRKRLMSNGSAYLVRPIIPLLLLSISMLHDSDMIWSWYNNRCNGACWWTSWSWTITGRTWLCTCILAAWTTSNIHICYLSAPPNAQRRVLTIICIAMNYNNRIDSSMVSAKEYYGRCYIMWCHNQSMILAKLGIHYGNHINRLICW